MEEVLLSHSGTENIQANAANDDIRRKVVQSSDIEKKRRLYTFPTKPLFFI